MKKFGKLTALAFLAATVGLGGVTAPTAQAGAVLTGSFGADNFGFFYLSTSANTLGTLIASTNTWNPATAVNVGNLLAGATYYLNFEVINGDPGSQYSTGGFLGSFSLSGGTFANGTTSLLTGTAGWLGIYNDSNYGDTAQPWIAPAIAVISEGPNGIGPWGTIGGISTSANWIWGADSQSEYPYSTASGAQCGACTVDFQASFTTAIPEPAGWTVMLAGLAALAGAGVLRKRAAAAA
jgi:hypothetical protein